MFPLFLVKKQSGPFGSAASASPAWELVRNVNYGPHPRPIGAETLRGGANVLQMYYKKNPPCDSALTVGTFALNSVEIIKTIQCCNKVH